ncbi:hypothetical protein C8R47DRAFT_991090, partial [Mycena vitilis]
PQNKPNPASAEPDILFIPIPQDLLCIRLFPGGSRPESGMFFFDFFDANRGIPVNAPTGYTVEVVWPNVLAGPLASLEATMGFTADPGLEKFPVMEQVRCRLARPRKPSYLFDIPTRARHPNLGGSGGSVGQAVAFAPRYAY